jgi:hypothetical protein
MCEAVESAGVRTFRDDRDIDGGDDIPDRIWLELQKAAELVVLVTPNSVQRPWVLFEAGAFWGKHMDRRIVVVTYLVDADSIPAMLRAKKAIALNDFDDYVVELKKRMNGGAGS